MNYPICVYMSLHGESRTSHYQIQMFSSWFHDLRRPRPPCLPLKHLSAPHAHGGVLLMEAMLVSEHRASTTRCQEKVNLMEAKKCETHPLTSSNHRLFKKDEGKLGELAKNWAVFFFNAGKLRHFCRNELQLSVCTTCPKTPHVWFDVNHLKKRGRVGMSMACFVAWCVILGVSFLTLKGRSLIGFICGNVSEGF